MEKVESFKLDHNKVKAPFVRKCCVLDGKMGDKVSKFDLRFLQPNKEAFGTAAMHGLEHLLATYLREELEGLIDLSPMGCRTGFYLVMWGDVEAKTVKEGLERALEKVLNAEEMIAATSVEWLHFLQCRWIRGFCPECRGEHCRTDTAGEGTGQEQDS